MIASIVSDNQAISQKIRGVLLQHRVECSLANVVSLSGALQSIDQSDAAPDLIFISLSPEPERALSVLHQLRRRTQSKLVAVGAAHDAKEILRVVHAGSDDYLDEEGELEGQITGLLDRVELLLNSDANRGRIITVMSSSGGVGCSMIASNLAFALANPPRKCCLCDLDLRRGDLASMLNLKPRHTIIDLCANLQKLDRQMFDEALLPHEQGVFLLAAPRRLDDVQQVTSDGVEKILHFARSAFPFVVVDLEDFFHREQFRVLQLSDRILFVYRMDFSALRNTRRTLDYLQKAGIDRDKVQLVANQYGRPKELSLGQVEEALKMKTLHYVPDDPRTVVHSLNCGVPAIVGNPRSKLAKAIWKLASNALVGQAATC
jgi:pilus assembly protein CpaE